MGFGPGGGGSASIGSSTDVALSNTANNETLVYDGAIQKWKNATSGGVSDASNATKGIVQLAGDLGGTAASPTVPGLASKAAAVHTHTASQITNASAIGQSVLTATDATAARTALGAGTSSLLLGATSLTAKAGDWTPSMADLPNGLPYFVLRTTGTPNPARPSVPGGTIVTWVDTVDGLAQPTNWTNNDIWIAAETVAEPIATQTFAGTAEGNTNGVTVTAGNSPFTYIDTGGGTNTQTYTTTSPLLGSVSYRISQASGGSQSNIGIANITPQDQWAATFMFNYESMPTQTGGSACLKAYNGNTWAGTDGTFTLHCTSTGNLFLNTGLGAAQGTVLQTGIGVIAGNTKYRVRLQGQVTANKIRMVLDTGIGTTILYDSGLVTPSGSNHEVGLFTAVRWGTGTSLPTSTVVIKGELYIGSGPGMLAIG